MHGCRARDDGSDQSLRASRTTMSKYFSALRSFIVGESVLSIKGSSLSFL